MKDRPTPTPPPAESAEPVNVNPFREIPVRYLGYANEVGESFRFQAPKLVVPTYVVAFGYCFADAAYLANKEKVSTKDKAVAFGDTLVWQSLASVMIPGLVINQVVKQARNLIGTKNLAKPGFSYLPTVLGLGVIPFICHPIDHGVEMLMDETVRKIYK